MKVYFNQRYNSLWLGILIPEESHATYKGMVAMYNSRNELKVLINPNYLKQYHFQEIGDL